MKNTVFLGFIIIMIAAAGLFVFSQLNEINSYSQGSGEIQKVTLSMKDLNYYPNEIRVKVNLPVSLSLDSSVDGCLRDIVIKDFGVAKNLKTPSDTLVFTPTKKGAFTFACSMGMAYGKIVVE